MLLKAEGIRHKYPLEVLGWMILQTAFKSASSVPRDFVQVFEVVLNLAWLVCWHGHHMLLCKTLVLMSAVSTILSTMVWGGLLLHQDILVQLNVFIARVCPVYFRRTAIGSCFKGLIFLPLTQSFSLADFLNAEIQ